MARRSIIYFGTRRERLQQALDDACAFHGGVPQIVAALQLEAKAHGRIDRFLYKKIWNTLHLLSGMEGLPCRAIIHAAWSTKPPVLRRRK